MSKYSIGVLAVMLAISGCGEHGKMERAKEMIRASLKDPDSAQFKDVHYVAETKAICGFVNAKNSYGGLTGFQQFGVTEQGELRMSEPNSEQWVVLWVRQICPLQERKQ